MKLLSKRGKGRAWAFIAVVLAVMSISGALVIAGRAQASDPPGADQPATDSEPLDPVAEALGADTPAEIVELQTAQERLTEIAENGSDEAVHVNDVRSDLGEAVDELYQDVADDPQAERARAWWRQCMAARGTPFDSPTAIEDAIVAPRGANGELAGTSLETVLVNRDECEQEASALLAGLLEGRFPEWVTENDVTIDEYRALIDSVSP